jgi:hypothetical protein
MEVQMHEATKTDKRALSIDYLMADDATLTRAEAEALYDAAPEAHIDDRAVDRFVGCMKRKMAKKRMDGRAGWHDPEQCTIGELSAMLIEHVDKGDPLDVAIFAMMIHQRGGRIDTCEFNLIRCVACDDVIQEGDMVYIEKAEGGFLHAECAGTDPEGFVDEDDNPLKPGDPIPEPFVFSSCPEKGASNV